MRRSVQLVLTVGVTWLVVTRVGVTLDDTLSMGPAVPDPSGLLLAASVVTLMVGLAISAWLWGGLVRELGGRSPGLLRAARIVFSANLGRYLPGKLWQIAGLVVLSERDGISRPIAAAAGVLGQAFALSAVGVLSAPVLLGPGETGAGGRVALLGALTLFVLLASVPRIRIAGFRLAFRIARVSPELPPGGSLFGLRWLGWYFVNWTIYGFAFVLFVHGLGFNAGWLGLVSAFAAAYLLGYAAVFAPAGLGVREGFLIAFLRPELGGGAVGVALLARLWMTVAELLPAGGFALWEVARTGRPEGVGSPSEKP